MGLWFSSNEGPKVIVELVEEEMESRMRWWDFAVVPPLNFSILFFVSSPHFHSGE